MTPFSLCHDQTKITKKIKDDNKCHYKREKRVPLEQKRSSGIITPILKKGEKVIDLYHSTKSVMQTISQLTLKTNIPTVIIVQNTLKTRTFP